MFAVRMFFSNENLKWDVKDVENTERYFKNLWKKCLTLLL